MQLSKAYDHRDCAFEMIYRIVCKLRKIKEMAKLSTLQMQGAHLTLYRFHETRSLA